MAKKILISVEITEKLMQRADCIRHFMTKASGVQESRTGFVEKAIGEYCDKFDASYGIHQKISEDALPCRIDEGY